MIGILILLGAVGALDRDMIAPMQCALLGFGGLGLSVTEFSIANLINFYKEEKKRK